MFDFKIMYKKKQSKLRVMKSETYYWDEVAGRGNKFAHGVKAQMLQEGYVDVRVRKFTNERVETIAIYYDEHYVWRKFVDEFLLPLELDVNEFLAAFNSWQEAQKPDPYF